jgi:hypothetical protein
MSGGPVRPPLSPPSASDKEDARRALAEIGTQEIGSERWDRPGRAIDPEAGSADR